MSFGKLFHDIVCFFAWRWTTAIDVNLTILVIHSAKIADFDVRVHVADYIQKYTKYNCLS